MMQPNIHLECTLISFVFVFVYFFLLYRYPVYRYGENGWEQLLAVTQRVLNQQFQLIAVIASCDCHLEKVGHMVNPGHNN